MRISHNIMAINTHWQFTVNSKNKSKSTERLSSGLALNRAGDDPSGLAVSEKMRALLLGLEQASRNTGDGISLVQTQEGAMQEIHNMLGRMRELTVQAMSDTYDSEVDRPAIQAEMEVLKAEIADIAEQTEFNGVKLLSGPSEGQLVSRRAPADVIIVMDISISMGTELGAVKANLGALFDSMPEGSRIGFKFFANHTDNIPNTPLSGNKADLQAIINAVEIDVMGATENGLAAIQEAIGMFEPDGAKFRKIIYIADEPDDYSGLSPSDINEELLTNGIQFLGCGPKDSVIDREQQAITEMEALVAGTGGDIFDLTLSGLSDGTFAETEEYLEYEEDPDDTLIVQSGSNEGDIIWLRTYDCRPETLGIADIEIDPRDKAGQALEAINKAIDTISAYRADAGAKQNQLEQRQKNLDSTAINIADAESKLRDIDMAEEMTQYYTYSVLSQASTAILAQANGMPQSVLNLIG